MQIADLMERYSLNSRQSLYARFKSLGLILEKGERGKINASPEQVELLDELAEHLKLGGSLRSFCPPEPEQAVEVEVMEREPEPGIKKFDSIIERLRRIVEETENKEQQQIIILPPERSPIQHHRELSEAAKEGWLLTSREVKELIGVYPRAGKGEDVFTRGCWKFAKAGKIGGAIAWRVEKVC